MRSPKSCCEWQGAFRSPSCQVAMEGTFLHLGDFCPVKKHFEKALLLYDPELHRDDAFRYSVNAVVGANGATPPGHCGSSASRIRL